MISKRTIQIRNVLLAAISAGILSLGSYVHVAHADPAEKTAATDKPAAKDDAADSSQSLTQLSPDIVFKDKGVSRSGSRLVVPDEAQVHEYATALKTANAKQKVEAMARKECDTAIAAAKKENEDNEVKYKHLNQYMGTISSPTQQNQLIARINSTISAQKVARQTIEDQTEKKKKLNGSREAYIDLVMEYAEKSQKSSHAYEDLAKDQELAAAIDRNNSNPKTAPKLKLGPTPYFLEDLAYIKKCRDDLSMEVLTVNTENNVPELDTVINGTVRTPMIWDSGATFVCISYDMADKLGLHPTEKDPILRCKIADGRIIEGHQMTLKTVQVGIFAVNDVDCMVMPPDIKDCPPLLGDSFQSHFAAKLDQSAGQLRLTPLDNPGKKSSALHPIPLVKPKPVAPDDNN